MTDYRETIFGLAVPATVANAPGFERDLLERIAELESGNDDGQNWLSFGDADFEFSRAFLNDVTRLARVMFIKNPIVQRGVKVKADYIFGRRVSIAARDEDINEVIQTFLDDTRNQDEFTSHSARIQKEIELQTDGNIFFVLLPNATTGRIRMRTIPVEEITDIICNPEDKKERWYYKREWLQKTTSLATGRTEDKKRVAYYRDWRYQPEQPQTKIGDDDVIPGAYVYHIRVGGFSDWRFGLSELYSALDWAKAYKRFLENWSTIVAAYAKFAFKVTTTGGKKAVDAAKAKLGSTIATQGIERNPAPASASNVIVQDGNDIAPIRTAGATTSANDGRRLLLMVAAAFGLPETFFGDVSVGTLATARSLDRPTELMLSNRQALWADIYNDILEFVVGQAVRAPAGPLRSIATIAQNEYGEDEVIFDAEIDKTIAIDFPSVIEIDPEAAIRAIISGSTFDGKTPTIIPDNKMLARMVLTVLGAAEIDETVNRLYPEDAAPADDEPEDDASAVVPEDDAELTPELESLREALAGIRAMLVAKPAEEGVAV